MIVFGKDMDKMAPEVRDAHLRLITVMVKIHRRAEAERIAREQQQAAEQAA